MTKDNDGSEYIGPGPGEWKELNSDVDEIFRADRTTSPCCNSGIKRPDGEYVCTACGGVVEW